mmetsp:Transcript_19230/g.53439  ORF Transcript_19230/g.53439 Transcript_19230/m.53439 type:complete len:277 (-) Transcript_19230:137-967(-)
MNTLSSTANSFRMFRTGCGNQAASSTRCGTSKRTTRRRDGANSKVRASRSSGRSTAPSKARTSTRVMECPTSWILTDFKRCAFVMSSRTRTLERPSPTSRGSHSRERLSPPISSWSASARMRGVVTMTSFASTITSAPSRPSNAPTIAGGELQAERRSGMMRARKRTSSQDLPWVTRPGTGFEASSISLDSKTPSCCWRVRAARTMRRQRWNASHLRAATIAWNRTRLPIPFWKRLTDRWHPQLRHDKSRRSVCGGSVHMGHAVAWYGMTWHSKAY